MKKGPRFAARALPGLLCCLLGGSPRGARNLYDSEQPNKAANKKEAGGNERAGAERTDGLEADAGSPGVDVRAIDLSLWLVHSENPILGGEL